MSERIVFHFEGALSDGHQMNFYEAARFQYAAARLLVKLDQFRAMGRFGKKISYLTNRQILLDAQRKGSFDIELAAPEQGDPSESFVNVPLSTLVAYIGERLVGKADDQEIVSALNAHRSIKDRFGAIAVENPTQIEVVLKAILTEPELRAGLYAETSEVFERRFAEMHRQQRISEDFVQVSRIDGAREQKLISMAAPLVSEMATALRRSANTLSVVATRRGSRSSLFFLNKRMAQEIETAQVDRDVTPILGNIIQYNKETGWGKVRIKSLGQPLSFSVPSDTKSRIQSTLLSYMGHDEVYLQTYFVRDKAGEIIRLIIIGVLPSPLAA